MKQPFRHKWIVIAAAALSLSLLAAALALVLKGTAGPPRSLLETASRPFLRLFSAASEQIRQVSDYFQGIDRLREENAALRQELEEREKEAQAGLLAAAENQRLRSLLDFTAASQDLTLEPAWVIARSPDNWQGTVTIDKGTSQGVRAGQCVIDAGGALVGRVKEAGGSWAAVTLLCDGSFQMAGMATSSGVLGSLEGDLSLLPQGKLKLTCLTKEDPVRAGEGVVTFAAQESYPSGLVVGRVTALEEDPGGLTRSAILTPAADLDNLGQVFVVTAFWEDQ